MKKNKIAFYILNVLITFLVTGVALYKIIDQNGIETFSYLKELSLISFLVLIGIFFVNYFLDGLIMSLSIKQYESSITPQKGFICQCVGGLFSGITPLKMGYFPGVAYVYSKFNVKADNMIKAMAKTGFSNQLLMMTISIITFIVCLANPISIEIGGVSLNLMLVSFIGVIYNCVLMVGYFIIVLSPCLHNVVLKFNSFLLFKFKLIEDYNKYYEEKKHKMELTRKEIKKYLSNFKESSIIFLLFLFKNLIYLAMPYAIFLLLTKGTFQIHMWLYSIVLWNLITCITNIIPLPGASGVAEMAFIGVFSLVFSPLSLINSIMIVWRIFSYFINIIVGFFVFIILKNIKLNKNILTQ